MVDRFSTAEDYYKTLLTGQAGLQEVLATTVATANKVNARPSFTFFLDQVNFHKLLVESNGNIVSLKTLVWRGLLFASDSGMTLDDVRRVAYPIIGTIRGLLDGAIFTYTSPSGPQEFVGPAHTTDEGPIEIEAGLYTWLISWEQLMQFTKGVS